MENLPKQSYTCKIFTVFEEDILLPNGNKTRQSWIAHKPTVAIVPVNEQGQLLLIKQYRSPVRQNLLEIPAGSLDDGELPVEAAGRELAEETGYRAGKLTKLFAGYLLPGYCNEFMYFFLAEDLIYAPLAPDEDEFIEVIPMSFAKAQEEVKRGGLIDAKTVLGLALARDYFRR